MAAHQKPATPASATPIPVPTPEPSPSPEAIVAGDVIATAKQPDEVEATKGEYTVAPGRTVDGRKPGEKVKLDEADAKRMLDLGFILDKDGTAVIRSEGPSVTAGAEITER